jgi:GH25 family lysozyme M1 (1,4-beta-N-acetylmuramidase)/LysM repeat protein
MQLKGIDVSRWQDDINWPLVKADGVDFVVLKSTQGETYEDPRFDDNAKGALAQGFEHGVGAYHYATLTSVADAIVEAKNLENSCRGYDFDFYVLDLECDNAGLSIDALSAAAKAFMDHVRQATGKKVGVYMNLNYFRNEVAYPSTGADFLWIARYRDFNLGAGVDSHIWQYADNGRVNGIAGNVDMDVAYTSFKDTKNPAPAPAPQPVPQPVVNKRQKNADGTYTIKSGDNLTFIARDFGTTVAHLVDANQLNDADHISVGQILRFDRPAPTPAPAPAQQTYTVQSGDVLSRLAVKFGVSMATLQNLNGISNPHLIRIGQVLKIPGSTPAPIVQPAAKSVLHTIARGDTVSELAAHFGSTAAQIKAWNNLDNHYT